MGDFTGAFMCLCLAFGFLFYVLYLHFERPIKREKYRNALLKYWILMRDYDTATCEVILSDIKSYEELKQFNKKLLKSQKNAKINPTRHNSKLHQWFS